MDHAFEAIRRTYLVAHEAYQESASHIASVRSEGRVPSRAEVAAEATALRNLSVARAAFMDAMSSELPDAKAARVTSTPRG